MCEDYKYSNSATDTQYYFVVYTKDYKLWDNFSNIWEKMSDRKTF